MRHADFVDSCKRLSEKLAFQGQETGYLNAHSERFFRTYLACEKLLPEGGKLLSVGAGSAYVETLLAHLKQASVTIFDFPEMLEGNQEHYREFGFQTPATDISQQDWGVEADTCDLVLSSEVIEHIAAPPTIHFANASKFLKPGGHFVVTTPNMGSLFHLLRIIRMYPTLPPPAQTFSPVCFDNEGIHRREYMPCELIEFMDECGLEHRSTEFIWYRHRPNSSRERWHKPFEKIVPRFRPAMILVAQKR